MCLRKKLSFSKKVVTGCTASSLVLDIVSASYFSHSNRRVVNSHRSFNLHFRNSWWWWTSAHVLTCHLCIFFGKVFVQLICSFFFFLVPFLLGHDFFLHVPCVCFCFCFLPCHMACEILVPQPGDQVSNPCPLQWKHGVLTTGPPGKSLICSFLNWVVSFLTVVFRISTY